MSAASTLTDLLVSAVRGSTPMAFALCGEIMGERAGIVNVGIEGEMLVGAAAGFATAAVSGNPWLGLFSGMAAGALLSIVHGVLCLHCRANQIASGVAVLALGGGASAYFGAPYVGRQISGFAPVEARWLPDSAARIVHLVSPTMVLGIAVPLLMGVFLFMTRPGLRWRAVGESPSVSRLLGIPTLGYRWAAVLVCGALAGLGGAALSVDMAKGWSEGMTAGRGLVAMGLVVLTRWNPYWTTAVALIFGAAESLSLSVQSRGIGVSPYLLSLFPYVTPLIVLALHARFGSRRGQMPASLSEILTFSA